MSGQGPLGEEIIEDAYLNVCSFITHGEGLHGFASAELVDSYKRGWAQGEQLFIGEHGVNCNQPPCAQERNLDNLQIVHAWRERVSLGKRLH